MSRMSIISDEYSNWNYISIYLLQQETTSVRPAFENTRTISHQKYNNIVSVPLTTDCFFAHIRCVQIAK